LQTKFILTETDKILGINGIGEQNPIILGVVFDP
jgi:hypothetical protein